MHETGVLTALFPELAQIDCLVIRDFYHRYTVDEHTLVAIQNVCAVRDAEDAPQRSFARSAGGSHRARRRCCSRCCFTIPAKASRTKATWTRPCAWLPGAMERIRMPAQERDTVLFLIGGTWNCRPS